MRVQDGVLPFVRSLNSPSLFADAVALMNDDGICCDHSSVEQHFSFWWLDFGDIYDLTAAPSTIQMAA